MILSPSETPRHRPFLLLSLLATVFLLCSILSSPLTRSALLSSLPFSPLSLTPSHANGALPAHTERPASLLFQTEQPAGRAADGADRQSALSDLQLDAPHARAAQPLLRWGGISDQVAAGTFELDGQRVSGSALPRERQSIDKLHGQQLGGQSTHRHGELAQTAQGTPAAPSAPGVVDDGSASSAFADTIGSGIGFADDAQGSPIDVFGRRHAEVIPPADSVRSAPALASRTVAASRPQDAHALGTPSGPHSMVKGNENETVPARVGIKDVISTSVAARDVKGQAAQSSVGTTVSVVAPAAASMSASYLPAAGRAVIGDERTLTPRWFDPSMQLVHTQVTTEVPVTVGVGDAAAIGALNLAKVNAGGVSQPARTHLPHDVPVVYHTPAGHLPPRFPPHASHGGPTHEVMYTQLAPNKAAEGAASFAQTGDDAQHLASDVMSAASAGPAPTESGVASAAIGFDDERPMDKSSAAGVGFPDEKAAALTGAITASTAAHAPGLPQRRWFDPSFGMISTEVSTSVPVTVAIGDQAAAGAFELDQQIIGGEQGTVQYPPYISPQGQNQMYRYGSHNTYVYGEGYRDLHHSSAAAGIAGSPGEKSATIEHDVGSASSVEEDRAPADPAASDVTPSLSTSTLGQRGGPQVTISESNVNKASAKKAMLDHLPNGATDEEHLPQKRWFDPSFGLINTEVTTSVPVTVAVGDQAAAGAFELDKQVIGSLQDEAIHSYSPSYPYHGYLYDIPNDSGPYGRSVSRSSGVHNDLQYEKEAILDTTSSSANPAATSAVFSSVPWSPNPIPAEVLAANADATAASDVSGRLAASAPDGPQDLISSIGMPQIDASVSPTTGAETAAAGLAARGLALANLAHQTDISKRDFDAYMELLHINVETHVPVNVAVADGTADGALGEVAVGTAHPLGSSHPVGSHGYSNTHGYRPTANGYAEHYWGWAYPPWPPAPPPAPPPPPSTPAGFLDDRERWNSHSQADWADEALSKNEQPLIFDTPIDAAGAGCGVRARGCGPVCCDIADRCNDANLGRCTDRFGQPANPIGFSGKAVELAQLQSDAGNNPVAEWWEHNKPPVSISAGPRISITGSTKTCQCMTCKGEPCTKNGDSFHKCTTCGSSSTHCHGDPTSSYVGCYFAGQPNMDHQCDCPG